MVNPADSMIRSQAVLLGQQLNLRPLLQQEVLATNPLMPPVAAGGQAVLFRFGVVVFFDVEAAAQIEFLDHLGALVAEPVSAKATEALEIAVRPGAAELVSDGVLTVADASLATRQLIADILAKSLLLEDYEGRLAATFDRVEPLAERLGQGRFGVRRTHELVKHIGETLRIQHRMVGRAAVGDKPDLLWEHPYLERLYLRLENEYEIHDRQLALERKLRLISDTAETLLDMLQTQRTLRVEWYIVILIVVEIVLTLYEMFWH
jgi:uncharacterized Rmd1/YagE family protein